jgi:putative colanic acid biosynthesis acetyltransferase WcaF
METVDMSLYKNTESVKEKIVRILWTFVWAILARPIPRSMMNGWKRFLLRCFGAKIHKTAIVNSKAIIYKPWNLEMREYACIDNYVFCYNCDKVIMEAHTTVSQRTFLCTSSHDITKKTHPTITKPIIIKSSAWVAADAFIGMGVTIGEGAVVGARAAVFKDVEPWTVVGGNPAKYIKMRKLTNVIGGGG